MANGIMADKTHTHIGDISSKWAIYRDLGNMGCLSPTLSSMDCWMEYLSAPPPFQLLAFICSVEIKL